MATDRRGFNAHTQNAALLALFTIAGQIAKSYAKGRLDPEQRFFFFIGMIVVGGVLFILNAAFLAKEPMVDAALGLCVGGLAGFAEDTWEKRD